jgi:hypothetical protein
METPRGIRNLNPGNIVFNINNDWDGQGPPDGRYATFVSTVYGIRAMVKVLQSYDRRGIDTVAAIITTWAPASDNNDTLAYIDSVCQRGEFQPNSPLSPSDYPALIDAIIYHENGEQPYSEGVIRTGIKMAG